MTEVAVSVIFTTYTEKRLGDVADLLGGLAAQTVLPEELLFVAEGDPELGQKVSALASQRGLSLRSLFNDGPPGLSAARNLAIPLTKGDIIAFIDDDAIPFPDWLQEMASSYRDSQVIGVTGAALPLWQDQEMAWLPREFSWLVSCTDWFDRQEPCPVRNAWGVNMSFRREAFDYGLFNARLGGNDGALDGAKLGPLGEDTEFCLRLRQQTGRAILYNPRVRVLHKVHPYRLTSRFVRHRSFWEGYTKARLRRHYRNGQAELETEYALLRGIALRFLPRLVAGAYRNPQTTRRQAGLALTSLSCVALGYCAGLIPSVGNVISQRFNR